MSEQQELPIRPIAYSIANAAKARARSQVIPQNPLPHPQGEGGSVVLILIACEFSGVVRRAFRDRGFDAWSCDLLPAEDGDTHHIQADCVDVILNGNRLDMVIAHPPCTHLASSGARWFKEKAAEQAGAVEFVKNIAEACERIGAMYAIENPIGVLSSKWRKPDQIIQPWQFGHGETKATCLWLGGLPKLQPTNIVEGREARIHKMAPGPNRWKERSRTYTGIAAAMAKQWGDALTLHRKAVAS